MSEGIIIKAIKPKENADSAIAQAKPKFTFKLKPKMLPEMQSVYHILTVHELQVRVNSMIQKQLYLYAEPENLLDILELVEMRFTINDKSCEVFHAFPGDNAHGIFISENETFEFGENNHIEDVKTEEGKSFLRWYYEITEDRTKYGKFQSLYMKFDD